MPDAPLPEPLRRVVDANLRYYQGLGRLTVDYLRSLGGLWNEVRGGWPAPAAGTYETTAPPAPSAPNTPPAPRGPALVLEGEAGAEAGGLFRVSNDLRRPVSAPVVVSAFRDESGGEHRVPLRVEPPVVTLEAGETALVQVRLTIPHDMATGATYHAEVAAPGLAEGGIPLLLRRLAATPAATSVDGKVGGMADAAGATDAADAPDRADGGSTPAAEGPVRRPGRARRNPAG